MTFDDAYRKMEQVLIDDCLEYEETPIGGIKFKTGVDTWIVIIEQVYRDDKIDAVLLHKDNLGGIRHKLYKGYPDYHIQKKFSGISSCMFPISYAMNHKKKWLKKNA